MDDKSNNRSEGKKYFESFWMYYTTFRKDKVTLFSLDSNTATLDSKEFENIVYRKLRELCLFLQSRFCSDDSPLIGIELVNNGFGDIVGVFTLSDIIITDCFHNNLDLYEIKTDTIVEPLYLASRLFRFEIYTSLYPHLKKSKRYEYMEGYNEMHYNYLQNGVKTFSEFIQYGNLLKEKNEYVEIYTYTYICEEFFPRVCLFINGRPYVQFRQANVSPSYDDVRTIPCYEINDTFYQYNNCMVKDRRNMQDLSKGFTSVKDALDYLFRLPNESNKLIPMIKDVYQRVFNFKSEEVNVLYDWVKNCYCFDLATENMIFEGHIEKKSNDKYFCKYTSLSTLISVLNNGNMRLNAIVSMNDPTETSKLIGEGCNFIDTHEGKDAILKYANYYYITSFTKNQDDLNMWRHYGDKAEGVCMVFEPIEGSNEEVCDVNYLKLNSKVLRRVNTFLESLRKKHIRFSIQSFVSKYLFIKPNHYRIEKERRLLIISDEPKGFTKYSNNIVVPYIERKLPASKEEYDSSKEEFFPLILRKIVLGPQMKGKEDNLLQIKYMIEKKLPYQKDIKVEISKVDCYRN